jgi:DNA gyrase subunit A
LASEPRRMQIIKDELQYVKDKYGDARRSIIEYSASEMRIEDLIPDEEVVVTISHAGYIKRTNLAEYKVQNRGGVGSKGSTTRDKDFLGALICGYKPQLLVDFHRKGSLLLDACIRNSGRKQDVQRSCYSKSNQY